MSARPYTTPLDRESGGRSAPAMSATQIVAAHFKGQVIDAEPLIPTEGAMPSGTFLVCGECTDEGGGSSGQCK